MNVRTLMKEHDLSINDLRWYLSQEMAKRLIHMKDNIFEITDFICSKSLENELFDGEERFLDELQSDFDAGRADEAGVREILYRINKAKHLRRKNGYLKFPETK